MDRLSALLDGLGGSAGVRGARFEVLCRWLLQNDPRYRAMVSKVWRWSEWPGRWGPDAGIDLVAETVDGGLWAVQAKAVSERYAVRKSDIDSFLSESSRPQFSYRLLIATTDRIGANALRTIDAQEKPVGVLSLSGLRRSPVVNRPGFDGGSGY